jgi:hypothetical protein
MGCGITRIKSLVKRSNTTFVKSLGDLHDTPYPKRKEHFEDIHNKFLNVTNKVILDDLDELERNKDLITKNLDIFWGKHETVFTNAGIRHTDFKMLIMEVIAEKIITETFSYKEYNVFKFIGTLLVNIFKISTEEKKLLYDILTEQEGEYLRMQKGFVYDIALHNKVNTIFLNTYYKGIHNSLKFNKGFQLHAFILILTPKLLNNDDLMKDIPEIIQYGESLNTVVISLHPITDNGHYLEQYNLTPIYYAHIMRIFKAIKENPRIKTVVFTCARDYKIILPPEITKIIIDKLDDDILMGFYIGNFQFSHNFMDEFWKTVVHLKNLLFLGFNIPGSEHCLEKIKDGVLKNKSLRIISLSGFEFVPKDLEGFRKMLSTQTERNLLFNYQEETDIMSAI